MINFGLPVTEIVEGGSYRRALEVRELVSHVLLDFLLFCFRTAIDASASFADDPSGLKLLFLRRQWLQRSWRLVEQLVFHLILRLFVPVYEIQKRGVSLLDILNCEVENSRTGARILKMELDVPKCPRLSLVFRLKELCDELLKLCLLFHGKTEVRLPGRPWQSAR